MYPSLEEAKTIAASGEYRRIPVCKEMLSDRFTPIEVMRTLRAVSRHCYMLESAEAHHQWGRYTFLGYAPTLEITCANGQVKLRRENLEAPAFARSSAASAALYGSDCDRSADGVSADGAASGSGKQVYPAAGRVSQGKNTTRPDGDRELCAGSPQEVIREILAANKSPKLPGMPSFTGGLVGYFSYDYICYSEPTLKFTGEDEDNFQDVDLMLFDQVIAFDNYRQKVILICGTDTTRLEESYREAEAKLNGIEQLLKSQVKAYFAPLRLKGELKPSFSRETYKGMVEKAKHYIREGDIFQVVLSNPIQAEAEGSLFDAYRILRTTNPSPYMFYFTSDDIELVGASPETLVKLEDGILHTFPLAGTRPRGATEEEDRQLEEELLADEKELSEHNMLVDLGRNDIGKISEIGSVHVEKYLSIERYSHVMHIGSTVAGQIRKDCDAVDAVDSILPAGTLSGAPKLRACQIIDELEGRKRGVYGGAIGYLDFTGNLDTCIAIRLAFQKNGRITIRSGAGIVADSVPDKEFEECCNKARAVINAVEAAEGGIEE